jgi:hypothetical protein
MAQAVAADYASIYSTAGSLAARPIEAERYAARPAIPAEAFPERVRREERARRAGRGVSLFSVVGYVAVASLMVLLILAYVNVNSVSQATVEMKSHLEMLTEEERRLKLAYESAFDAMEIESYAVNVLGMIPAADAVAGTIDVEAVDKAVIIGGDETKKGGALDGLAEFISSLLEYLK